MDILSYMWMLHHLLSFLFPAQCVMCKKKNVSLCTSCLATCRRSLGTPHAYVYAHFAYKDIAHILHKIKYFGRTDLISPLVASTLDGDDIRNHIKHLTSPLLVPIPSPRTRIWMRGYNPAEEIARAYSNALSIPYATDLKRAPVARQTTLRTRQERTHRVRSMYLAHTERITGKDIILVDDIITTGATIEEAKKCLLESGARNICAITLAH